MPKFESSKLADAEEASERTSHEIPSSLEIANRRAESIRAELSPKPKSKEVPTALEIAMKRAEKIEEENKKEELAKEAAQLASKREEAKEAIKPPKLEQKTSILRDNKNPEKLSAFGKTLSWLFPRQNSYPANPESKSIPDENGSKESLIKRAWGGFKKKVDFLLGIEYAERKFEDEKQTFQRLRNEELEQRERMKELAENEKRVQEAEEKIRNIKLDKPREALNIGESTETNWVQLDKELNAAKQKELLSEINTELMEIAAKSIKARLTTPEDRTREDWLFVGKEENTTALDSFQFWENLANTNYADRLSQLGVKNPKAKLKKMLEAAVAKKLDKKTFPDYSQITGKN